MLVKNWMSKPVITVDLNDSMQDAVNLVKKHSIRMLPVTEKGELVGIITQTDLFNVIFSLTGVAKKGIQFALKLIDTPRCIQQITDIIRNYGSQVSSILTSCERVPPGYSMVYIRIFDIDQPSLQRLIEEIREKATIIYIVDHDIGKRYIYESEDTDYSISNF